MDEFFMAVTANILDDDIVQSAEETIGETIANVDDVIILMDLYNKEEFEYLMEKYKYATGKIVMAFINPKESSCTIYRYGYPDEFSEIIESILPAIENSYKLTTGKTLGIQKVFDKRKDFQMGLFGILN